MKQEMRVLGWLAPYGKGLEDLKGPIANQNQG